MTEERSNPVMYIFVNKSLGMSPGKLMSQSCHAACNALRMSGEGLISDWYEFGFYTKLIMEARDELHLKNIQKYLKDRGIESSLIIDEGRTEIPKHSVTALGVEIIDKNVLGPIFKEFKLYKPEMVVTVKFK